MKKYLLLFIVLTFSLTVKAQNCEYFDFLMGKARILWAEGKFEHALNQLSAAREDCPKMASSIDAQLVFFTKEISRKYREAQDNSELARAQTISAEKQAQKSDSMARAYREFAIQTLARDMVFKSNLAFINGDRNTAFRLAEFANDYVIQGDSNVMQAMTRSLYLDNRYIRRRYPRQSAIEGVPGSIDAFAISPDGASLAIGTASGEIIIRELGSLKIIQKWNAHASQINSITFSPKGSLLISMGRDSMVQFWEPQTVENIFSERQTTSDLYSGIVSPDGKSFAFRIGKLLLIKDISDWKTIYGLELPFSFGRIIFSSDSKLVCVKMPPIGQTLVIRVSSRERNVISKSIYQIKDISCSPSDSALALATSSHVEIWNLNTMKLIRSEYGIPSPELLSFCSRGDRLAIASAGAEIRVWDYKSGYAEHTIRLHSPPISEIIYSSTNQYLIVQTRDNYIRIFNLWNNEEDKAMKLYASKLDSINADFANNPQFSSDLHLQNILRCDLLSKAWAFSGIQSAISANDLEDYGLENLLAIHPENESKLIATGEVWQIKAFADLAASRTGSQNIFAKVNLEYERADRLYKVALDLEDVELIRLRYAEMLRNWAEACRSEGLEAKSKELMERADTIWIKKG